MEMDTRRRQPSKEKSIEDITSDDFRVRVLGVVVDRDEDDYSIMLDDGTGRAVVQFSDPDQFHLAEAGKRIRVIGRVMVQEGVVIDAELIQDMSKLDMGLYEQVRYVTEKIRGE
ncbi:MAG: replication protein RepA [Candidatus Hydrothermarchaeales archaeon]